MKKIQLTKNKYAIVDDNVYQVMNKYKWHYLNGYACRRTIPNRKYIKMHRVILDTPIGKYTDHINGNKLDNRLCNLRACTNSQNMMNRDKPSNNTSNYKGVSYRKDRGVWRAYITVMGKTRHLGHFNTPEDAHKAYVGAAKEMHKEFAYV